MESSPRFRTTESRPEPTSTHPYHHTTSPTKLRLMCSAGGHILPRPHDKSLCYVGGETRIVAVDRHTTLLELTQRISKTLFKSCNYYSHPGQTSHATLFTLKYQLPSEDLDSLISVTTDEDLENMIDEYERLNLCSRIRLFVFPTNPESNSNSIGSFLENPSKSEDWFLNALNGTGSGFSDTSSVNYLLDLDDEISLTEKKEHKVTIGMNNRGNNSGQDVHSIPDSGQETNSSFGSATSTPSDAKLAPIRVNPDDHLKILGGGIEEQFAQLMGSPAPVAVSGLPVSSGTVIKEGSDPFLWCGEKLDQGLRMDYVKHHQQQSTGFDLASMDSIMSDLTITDQSSPVSQIQTSSPNNIVADPHYTNDHNTRIQMQQQQQNIHNPDYLMPMPTTQVSSPRHQLHHQQPQFIPQRQYIHHHHHTPVAVPVSSYYQQPMDPQNFVYYIPTRQPPQGYNFPLQQQQTSHADTRDAAATKTELPAGVYRTSAGAPQLVRVPSGYQNHAGYSQIHQPTQSVYYATALSTGQYQKITSVSPVEAGLQEQQVRTAQP